ncbi:MAG TPA: hypothetical protein VIL14_00280 [Nitrososphaeraceae archaeon]
MLQINNKSQNKSLGIIIIITALLFMSFANMGSILKTYAQEKTANPSLELTAKLVGTEYRWIGSNNTTNPTLNLTSGVDNQIAIKSILGDPTEHELVIEGVSGKGLKTEELISSDEIENGSSTTINFNSTDIDAGNYDSIDYYCEYHPETMLGKLQIN